MQTIEDNPRAEPFKSKYAARKGFQKIVDGQSYPLMISSVLRDEDALFALSPAPLPPCPLNFASGFGTFPQQHPNAHPSAHVRIDSRTALGAYCSTAQDRLSRAH